MDVVAAGQGFGGGTAFLNSAAAIAIAPPNFDNGVHHTSGSDAIGVFGGTGLNRYADPAAMYRNFRYPLLSADGRNGRGALRDYIVWNLDAGIGKMTRLTEKTQLGFSVEILNAFNHVIWIDPTLDVNDPGSFGVLQYQANNPRVIQLGLRIEW